MRIWKYQIPLKDSFTINMPSGADVLCVQLQSTRHTNLKRRFELRIEKRRAQITDQEYRERGLVGSFQEVDFDGERIGVTSYQDDTGERFFEISNGTLCIHVYTESRAEALECWAGQEKEAQNETTRSRR